MALRIAAILTVFSALAANCMRNCNETDGLTNDGQSYCMSTQAATYSSAIERCARIQARLSSNGCMTCNDFRARNTSHVEGMRVWVYYTDGQPAFINCSDIEGKQNQDFLCPINVLKENNMTLDLNYACVKSTSNSTDSESDILCAMSPCITVLIIVGAVAGFVIAVLGVAAIILFIRLRRSMRQNKPDSDSDTEGIAVSAGAKTSVISVSQASSVGGPVPGTGTGSSPSGHDATAPGDRGGWLDPYETIEDDAFIGQNSDTGVSAPTNNNTPALTLHQSSQGHGPTGYKHGPPFYAVPHLKNKSEVDNGLLEEGDGPGYASIGDKMDACDETVFVENIVYESD